MSTQPSIFSRLRANPESTEWDTFCDRCSPVVFSVAMAHGLSEPDARDAVQDVMLRLYKNMGHFRYDPARGRFRNYLYTITLNVVRAQLADRARRAKPLEPAQLYAVHNPKEIWEREWRANELRAGLQAVAKEVEPKTFQAFQLFVLEEWSTEKVARFLGLSRQSVYQAKSRVIRKLREHLADTEDDDG